MVGPLVYYMGKERHNITTQVDVINFVSLQTKNNIKREKEIKKKDDLQSVFGAVYSERN